MANVIPILILDPLFPHKPGLLLQNKKKTLPSYCVPRLLPALRLWIATFDSKEKEKNKVQSSHSALVVIQH